MLRANDYDGSEIIGVYSTKQKAQKVKEELEGYYEKSISIKSTKVDEFEDPDYLYSLALIIDPVTGKKEIDELFTEKEIFQKNRDKNTEPYIRIDWGKIKVLIYSKKSFLDAYQKTKSEKVKKEINDLIKKYEYE